MSHAAVLAAEVRRAILGRALVDAPLRDFDAFCRAGGFAIRPARLLPEQGGKQALLIPKAGDAFDIRIDPTPRHGWDGVDPQLRKDLERHRARFLIAHEMAHSFFFTRGRGAPRRQGSAGRAEEAFCDEFARWLLVPHRVAESASPTAAEIARLQQCFDVSLEVAARAVAAAQELWIGIGLVDGSHSVSRQWSSADHGPGNADPLASPIVQHAVRRGSAQGQVGERLALDAHYRPERRQVVLVGKPL